MKKTILITILLVSLVAGSVMYADSKSINSLDLIHSLQSVDKIKPAISGESELNCIDSNCLYLPLVAKAEFGADFGDWIRYSEPVLEPGPIGGWEEDFVICPEVLFDGTQYRMWYSGGKRDPYMEEIGYATSVDGIHWEKYPGNPILKSGEPGDWDDARLREPVVFNDGSSWKMWYQGLNEATGNQIGYATSEDGISWLKFESNPVLSGGSGPSVLFIHDGYHMWYSNGSAIEYATSNDGTTWTKFSGNPIITAPIGELYDDLKSPSVVEVFGEYNMWLQESIWGHGDISVHYIIHKTSLDGINWADGDAGIGGSYEFCPSVKIHDNSVKMWYTENQRIYYAEAPLLP